MKDIKNFTPQKILVLQQRQLGDVIVSTPVFSVLRKKYPHAQIDFFTEDKCIPLVSNDPHINSFQMLNKSKSQPFFQKIFSQWKTYWNIRKTHYDIIIDLQQLPRCQMVTLFSGAKYKISFTPRHVYKKVLYTHCSVAEDYTNYISYGKTSLLQPLGIQASYEKPMLYLKEEEKEHAQSILRNIGIDANTPFITMDATHKHKHRRWKYYHAFIEKFLLAYPEYKILLLRAKGEEEQLLKFIEIDSKRVCMPEQAPDLRQSMACMSYASFHVGNTSAPAHMALALGVPALVILSHTAKMWHFDPQKPEKGMPKQIEVRVEPEKLNVYKKALKEYAISTQQQEITSEKSTTPKRNLEETSQTPFTVMEYPELDLITSEQVFLAFEQLFQEPFYT